MRHFIILSALVVTLSACDHAAQQAGGAFTTEKVSKADSTEHALARVTVDFPKGNDALSHAIQEFVSERLGGTFTGSTDDASALVKWYVGEKLSWLQQETDGIAFPPGDGPQIYDAVELSVLEDNDRYVTYLVTDECYLGGAHGSFSCAGATFRKSDGRRMGYDMLRPSDGYDIQEGWYRLIKEGVRGYFAENGADVETDEQLEGMLMGVDFVDAMPNPQAEPYLTEKGVNFVYQQYEIAAYAAGLPSFVIPYDSIRPYLTTTALRLIGK